MASVWEDKEFPMLFLVMTLKIEYLFCYETAYMVEYGVDVEPIKGYVIFQRV